LLLWLIETDVFQSPQLHKHLNVSSKDVAVLKITTPCMRKFVIISILILSQIVCRAQIYTVQDMSTVQIDSLDRDSTIVLLQGGILEEHGPYLPCFTDGYINLSLTKDIANAIAKRKGMKILIFPIIPLGTGGANEIGRKYSFPGTYAIRQSTLRAILMDLSSEIGGQGFKTIFVIHSHGSPNHNHAIDEACEYFTDTYKGRMINIWNLGFDVVFDIEKQFLNEKEQKEEGLTPHAGADEHSQLQYLKPEFKKLHYKEAKPVTADSAGELVTLAEKKDWPGYFGSPRLASTAFGEKISKAWTSGIIKQVNEIVDNKYDFTKPTYYQQMAGNPVFDSINKDAENFDKEREASQKEWLKSKGLD
jgi:creatinine amidohydrolase/Fe(II)-dependent formamide hydrolase-like protein